VGQHLKLEAFSSCPPPKVKLLKDKKKAHQNLLERCNPFFLHPRPLKKTKLPLFKMCFCVKKIGPQSFFCDPLACSFVTYPLKLKHPHD